MRGQGHQAIPSSAKSHLASYFPASWGRLLPWASSLFSYRGLGSGPLYLLAWSHSPLASLPPFLTSSSCPPQPVCFFLAASSSSQGKEKAESIFVLSFPGGKGLGSQV